MQAVLDAKRQNLVKHVGITSHNPVNVMRALKRFNFDTVLLPVNCVLRANRQPLNDYEPALKLARERNMGVIAMKAIAKGPWPEKRSPTTLGINLSIHSERDRRGTVVHPFSECGDGRKFIRLATMMLDAAERFEPMSHAKQKELVSRFASHKPLFPREASSK